MRGLGGRFHPPGALYDLRPLTTADYPGHADCVSTGSDRLGFARPLWRTLTYRTGDLFADWVVYVCAKALDPWEKLKACVALAEIDNRSGNVVRERIAELLLPDRPPAIDYLEREERE